MAKPIKKNLEILLFRFDSSESNTMIDKFIAYSSNCIILVYDFEKISVKYVGPQIDFEKFIIPFYKIPDGRMNKIFKPFLFLLDLILMFKIFSRIFKKFYVETCWIENLYAACIVGFFKILKCCKRMVYVPGDWLVNWTLKNPYSFFANNLLFPFLDYLGCRVSDLIFLGGERLLEARLRFYGKNVMRKQMIFSPLAFPGTSVLSSLSLYKNKAMCFLGDLRMDSGLEIVLESLGEIRKNEDIVLKIIGPRSQNEDYFKKLVLKYRIEKYVSFLGFVQKQELKDVLSDCFCGLNVLTIENSYSNYVIPGKQIYYLQYLLPIITTQGGGILVSDIEKKGLGMVVEPQKEAFQSAALKIYKDQYIYRKNILDYMNSIRHIEIKEVFEKIKQ